MNQRKTFLGAAVLGGLALLPLAFGQGSPTTSAASQSARKPATTPDSSNPAASVSVAPAGGTFLPGTAQICAASIDDTLNPGMCIEASTAPELGKLFPISTQFYIAPGGRVGLGTTSPIAQLSVIGGFMYSDAGVVFPDFSVQTSAGWALGGNAGTTPGADFIGTSDMTAVEFQVNSNHALSLTPNPQAPNVIGGNGFNTVAAGVGGASIGGGGLNVLPNSVFDFFGSVGGGNGNTAGDDDGGVSAQPYATVGGGTENTASGHAATVGGGQDNLASGRGATVPGGELNEALGDHSFAGGLMARTAFNGSFVWADSTGATLAASVADQFLVRASGGAVVLSGAATGVSLAAGAGTWTMISDRDMKQEFADVDAGEVLEKLASMDIQEWSYKAQDDSVRHIGPTAQDFYDAFGLGLGDTTIDTVDLDGISLLAIQALAKRTAELDETRERVTTLETELAELKASIAELQASR